MYHIEYGNKYGVSYINTNDIKYIRELKAYIDKLGGYSFRVYSIIGDKYIRQDINKI